MFESIRLLPPDPILGLLARFRADPRAGKIDLGVGVYQDETGHTPVMGAVREAEARLLATQTTKTYQGIVGDPLYNERLLALTLGAAHPAIRAGRIRGVQTPGGCGALRIGAEVLRRAHPAAKVWVSRPTWANHIPLIGGSGLEIVEYPYYDPRTGGIDFDAMMGALAAVQAGDVVLVHGCCHNPTGADLSLAEWRELTALAVRNGFTPYIDTAYQGLAEGLDEDAAGLRHMVAEVPECVLAVSCSKNFGLYRERAGAVYFLTRDIAAGEATLSNAMNVARQIYSMPPAHGAAIVSTILGDDALATAWRQELDAVRGRINAMRALLAARLNGNAAGIDFSFIRRQKGMFSYLGIGAAEVTRLREEFAVYMLDSTRINVAGITPGNIDRLAEAVHTVLGRPAA
jgi:aspartate/tyrosine/aromatic aminotransferase